MPEPRTPSPWILRFAPLVPAGAAVLDLACGRGRHARLFLARGHPVTAVDRDLGGLEDIAGQPGLEIVEADLEDVSPWPLPGLRFGAVVVVNYLWRPLFPRISRSGLPLARAGRSPGRPLPDRCTLEGSYEAYHHH
jgi:SAM-dependent methyltransferase